MIATQQTLFNRLLFTDLISFFPPHIRAQLYNKTDTRTFKAGEVIFKRGEPGPWFACILSGRVRLCIRNGEGKELLLSTVERGEVFGERAFFDSSLRAGDAIAEEETTFTVITQDEFFPLLLSYPEAMFNIIKILCNRIGGYLNTMELYALQDLPTRIAQVLLSLAQKFGREVDGRMVVHAGLNQSDLGQLVGSSRESVNKQLKIFCTKGYIAIEGDDLILLNVPHLQKMTTPVITEETA
jgi:CRP/FNR family cyclic AMP-dependent transcriptional regulator